MNEFKVGDRVELPFNQEGVILKIIDMLWGHPYIVEITEGTLNAEGDTEHYKKEQMKLIESKPLTPKERYYASKEWTGGKRDCDDYIIELEEALHEERVKRFTLMIDNLIDFADEYPEMWERIKFNMEDEIVEFRRKLEEYKK